jgi:hypothetical protein
MTWQLPDTYHLAGHGRGTATLKFYEGRDILRCTSTPGSPNKIEVPFSILWLLHQLSLINSQC